MADATVHPLRPDGGVLPVVGARVLEAIEGLLPSMGAAYRREVAEYAAMTAEHFGHVLQTSSSFVATFAELLRDGVDAPVPDHARLVAAGRRRQEDGVSLDAAMHAFRIASRVGWTAIADAAQSIDPHLVGELAGRWIEYADRAATAFAEGHATAATEQLRRVDARRQAVVADLLAADDSTAARAVAAQYGLDLAATYRPVLLAGSDTFDGVDRAASVLGETALVGRRGDRVVALVRGDRDVRPDLAPLATSLLVGVGRPARPGAALLAEVAAVESTLTAAVAIGRPAGLLEPDDLLLARVVREHAPLQAHLEERVLAPLREADGDGIFTSTLRAYVASGSVPRAAAALYVHANTVTYRLGRVRDLTGLDPRVPADAALLVLALELDGGTP